jgi:hypothetical protein
LELAQKAVGRELVPSQRERSAININMHDFLGSRYDWHVDSNPVTGLLFASTLRESDGGSLVFDDGDGCETSFCPERGRFLVFDARRTPHTVTPLTRPLCRLSIPMNFFFEDEPEERPADLDAFLYEPAVERKRL